MQNEMTGRQREVYLYIKNCTIPPTVREIGAALGISSPNGVVCHLHALEKKGWIERERKRSRTIRVIERCRLKSLEGGVEDFSYLFREGNSVVPLFGGYVVYDKAGDYVGAIRRITRDL